MTGSLNTADIIARALASAANAVVVTPHYRLAPEHLWPSGLNDARDALSWVRNNIDSLGGDPGQIVVGGDSAGGNLAAILAHESRDTQPGLAAQVLIYPVVDLDLTSAQYPSRTLFAKGYHLELADLIQCVTTYLPENTDVSDPSVSPIRSATFAGLPPAVIATADLDPLRDEGRLYAERLREAGVPVQYLNTPGLVHGGFDMLGVSPTARSAMAGLVDALTQLL
jgi:acetyl esterase